MREPHRSAWAAINASAQAEGMAPCLRHVVIACAKALSAVGAGLLVAHDGEPREPVFATGPRVEELEELQLTLGEGPGFDALSAGGPVLAGDLAADRALRRWPTFAPAAAARGIRTIAAFPIRVGGARLGALGVYREEAALPEPSEVAQGLLFADAALVLAARPGDGVAPDLEKLVDSAAGGRRAEVHQATGMVAAQLELSVADALVALRAHAFASDRRLNELAVDVVTRKVRFGPPEPPGRPPWPLR